MGCVRPAASGRRSAWWQAHAAQCVRPRMGRRLRGRLGRPHPGLGGRQDGLIVRLVHPADQLGEQLVACDAWGGHQGAELGAGSRATGAGWLHGATRSAATCPLRRPGARRRELEHTAAEVSWSGGAQRPDAGPGSALLRACRGAEACLCLDCRARLRCDATAHHQPGHPCGLLPIGRRPLLRRRASLRRRLLPLPCLLRLNGSRRGPRCLIFPAVVRWQQHARWRPRLARRRA